MDKKVPKSTKFKIRCSRVSFFIPSFFHVFKFNNFIVAINIVSIHAEGVGCGEGGEAHAIPSSWSAEKGNLMRPKRMLSKD